MAFDNTKLKAVTFSYDDGVFQDKRLVEIFNKYNLKCTFNINSGIQSSTGKGGESAKLYSYRLNYDELFLLYKGHEVAVHSLTHPHLENLDIETINNEIKYDKKILEYLFNQEVVGCAYPCGTYDRRVVEVLKQNNIKYARTTKSTNRFLPQKNLLEFDPTCHHNAENLMDLAKSFIELKPRTQKIFYIWGHSYEFDNNNNWNVIEEFCEYISGREDIFYGTNREVFGV